MSKASEWAAYFQSGKKDSNYVLPQFRPSGWEDRKYIAAVHGQGGLHFRGETLTATEALEFARWILDTFGDSPREASGATPASSTSATESGGVAETREEDRP